MTTTTFFSFLKPRRWWLQFRLKTIFVLVVIATIPCVLVKAKMNRKQKERAAVAEIVRIGGYVCYDWEAEDEQEPSGAAWLRKLLGENFFSKVVMVDLAIRGIDDAHVLHLNSVSLEVTDAWLVNLEPMTDVEGLHLAGKQISDIGLMHLVVLTQLKTLDLYGTGVTDNGLDDLKRLSGLTELGLKNTAVTDAGIAKLQAALPNCQIER